MTEKLIENDIDNFALILYKKNITQIWLAVTRYSRVNPMRHENADW